MKVITVPFTPKLQNMNVFNVSYDLNKAGQNYEGLIKEIKNSHSWAHPLKSTWLVATTETATALSQRLRNKMDQNDHILVIRVTNDYQGWLSSEHWDWMKKYITQCATECSSIPYYRRY